MFTGAEGAARGRMSRYIFHVRASYYDETEKIVEQVLSTGGKKIAGLLTRTTATARPA
jgi:hypothetical protein